MNTYFMLKKSSFIILSLIFIGIIGVSFITLNKTVENKQEALSIITARAVDTDGKVHRIGVRNKATYPVSLIFIDIGCTISQRMIPRLNELLRVAKTNKVQFYGVISNPEVTWQEARKFKNEFKVEFPILFDANGDLAVRLNPSVVPESFVIDKYDKVAYYGRINDQYLDVGKFSNKVKHPDLLNAIKAVAKGSSPSVKHQPAKGCIFESWDKLSRALTFNKDIEPLMRANCVECHKPNDIGPFPLISYRDVSKRARMVDYVCKKGFMPIWKGKKGYGKFSNEHNLSGYQKSLITQWINQGAKEGDREDLMPALPVSKSEWKLGEPDLIVKMEPYDLPASGDDQYRVFVIKDAIPKGKVIKGIDFKAGAPSVVHHSTIFVDYSQKLRKFDDEDPKSGYDAFEKGGTMEFGSAVPVCGWAPGVGPYSYPDNVGFYVEQNADIAFENHYHLSGKAITDQSYMGIYFADKTPEKYITGSIIGSQKLNIPAGEEDFVKTIWTYVPTDIELFDLTPHMHYIGTGAKVDVILPDGTKKPLLHIDDWDLRWQGVYTLRELTKIPKGSIITAEFHYDNSDDNHDNPYYPAKDMFWGWGSSDEMCEVYFSYVPSNPNEYGKMLASSFTTFEHSYPASERVNVTEGNVNQIAKQYASVDVFSNKGQQLLFSIVESSMSTEVLEAMKNFSSKDANYKINKIQLKMSDAFLNIDIPRLSSASSKGAVTLYNIRYKDKSNWNANYLYAKMLMDSGVSKDIKNGVEILESLVNTQEKTVKQNKYALPYWELGKYYYSLKNDKSAEEILKRGLKHHPTHTDLLQELGSDGRIVKKTLK